jgi:Carboxypeptidase regulatory-like domain/Divergent InlB B-repeat domain
LAGESTQTLVTVVLDAGSPLTVALVATGLPLGASASFTPSVGTASFVSLLILNTTASVGPGSYQIIVVGTSGDLVASVAFQLTVQPAKPATYTLTVSPPSAAGGTTNPPSGAYNYTAGQLVTVSAVPSAGWSFTQWMVNGSQAGNGTQLAFTVNGNTEVTPVFSQTPPPVLVVPQASVSFLSNGEGSTQIMIDGTGYSLPTSFSWPIGSNHTASVQGVISIGNATQLLFVGWQGGLSSNSSTLNFTVKNNMTVMVAYQARYLVNLAFVDSVGGVVSPQAVTVFGPQGSQTVSSTNSSIWLDSGANYTLAGATTDGTKVTSLIPIDGAFTVTKPETVTIPLSIYPVSVKLVDAFGQPISGATVTLTTEGGEQYTQVTSKNGSATFADVPTGQFNATYSYLGVSGSLSSATAGAHSNTVTVALSYPIISVVVVFAAALAIALIRVWRPGRIAGIGHFLSRHLGFRRSALTPALSVSSGPTSSRDSADE